MLDGMEEIISRNLATLPNCSETRSSRVWLIWITLPPPPLKWTFLPFFGWYFPPGIGEEELHEERWRSASPRFSFSSFFFFEILFLRCRNIERVPKIYNFIQIEPSHTFFFAFILKQFKVKADQFNSILTFKIVQDYFAFLRPGTTKQQQPVEQMSGLYARRFHSGGLCPTWVSFSFHFHAHGGHNGWPLSFVNKYDNNNNKTRY